MKSIINYKSEHVLSGQRSCESGFMLLEALFSILLLSFGSLVIFHAFRGVTEAVNYRTFYQKPAHALADSLLTEVELAVSTNSQDKHLVTGEQGIFNYVIEKSDWPFSQFVEQFTARVTWQHMGRHGEVELTTVLPVRTREAMAETNPQSSPYSDDPETSATDNKQTEQKTDKNDAIEK